MRLIHLGILLAALVSLAPGFASARDVVEASAPSNLALTLYRDPDRRAGRAMEQDYPQGFAMISETRTVTLPAGRSTIRFEGVAEGMVAVTAIVTGLPSGTIEKNRNADILSPAALVNGYLGNRVTITRTNPATGVQASERAIVRTRADGGLVLQTGDKFEAVRCAGLPERLSFDGVPDGLSAQPVFTIDTRDDAGGTYEVTLTYLAWGFDWTAHYVATIEEINRKGQAKMRWLSWLTLLNDNGQSFPNAELLAVAGTINVESDFEGLADKPYGRPLRLRCYPLGNTKRGSPIGVYPPPPPPEPSGYAEDGLIVVTGARRAESLQELPMAVSAIGLVALEEQLGDLKLFRVPERVSVNAKGLKQVAFLNKEKVKGELIYETRRCDPYNELYVYEDGYDEENFEAVEMLLATVNDKKHGLGVALPTGGFTIFEPSSAGDLLIGEEHIRDYAVGQDVEVPMGDSTMVFSQCGRVEDSPDPDDVGKGNWVNMRAVISNSGSRRVVVRLDLGRVSEWEVKKVRGLGLKDGKRVITTRVKPGEEKLIKFRMRLVEAQSDDD